MRSGGRAGEPRRFSWFNWTRRSSCRSPSQRRARFDVRWAEEEELRLAKLPGLERPEALQQFLSRAVQGIEEEGRRQYPNVMGRAAVLAQRPQHRPARPERSPRPPCHTTIRELLDGFVEQYRAFTTAFQAASTKWRSGDVQAQFPGSAVRPFLWPTPTSLPLAA